MVTMEAIRSLSTVAGQPACWPASIALLDLDGRPLSEADVAGPFDDGCVALGEVAEPDLLLDYYFGRAGRRLMLDLGDRMIDGWLETRWDGGGRTWWVELDGDLTG